MKTYIAEYQPWTKKVFQQFKPEYRKILLESFRFNPVGWEILFQGDRFRDCVKVLKAQVEQWTPLNISLLDFADRSQLEAFDDGKLDDFLNVLMQRVRVHPGNGDFSRNALGIAFQIIERLQNEDVKKVFSFLSVYGDQDLVFNRDLWTHVFAIIDSILDDPEAIYVELLRDEPSSDAIQLVATSILAQPVTKEMKFNRLISLLGKLRVDEVVGIIQYLAVRGADSLAVPLAKKYLEIHSFDDVFDYRMNRIPVFKQQGYLQRINHFLLLNHIAGNIQEYQRGIDKYGTRLINYGFAFSVDEEICLQSLVLTPSQIEKVLAIPDWDLWANSLAHTYFGESEKVLELLKFFYMILHSKEPIEDQLPILGEEIASDCVWFSYFRAIVNHLIQQKTSETFIQQIVSFITLPCNDYGIDMIGHEEFLNVAKNFFNIKQILFWDWALLIEGDSTETIQGEILFSYAELEDWGGVIETAQWIRKERELTIDGNLLLAKAYLAIDEIEEAISASRDVLALDTTNAEANLLIGIGYSATGNTEMAVDHLGRAVDYDSANEMAWIALADIQRKIGRNDLVIATLERGLEALPGHAELSYMLSQALSRSGQKNAAQTVLTGNSPYIRENPERLHYYLDLLWEIQELTRLQEVVFSDDAVFEEQERVIYYRAKLFEIQDRKESALIELRQYLVSCKEVDKSFFDLYFSLLTHQTSTLSLSEAHLSGEEIEELSDIIRAAMRIFPQDLHYQIYFCELQILSGQYQEAYQLLQSISFQGESLDLATRQRIEFNFAVCSRFMGEIDMAMATFESLLQLHPDNASVLMQLAEIYLMNNIPGQVEKYANLAVDKHHDAPEIVEWYIAMLKCIMSNEQIQQYMGELIENHPSSLPLRIGYIRTSLSNEDKSFALHGLNQIVQSDFGLSENDRIELIQLALESGSLDIVSRLIDAGGESFQLPLMMLVQYVIFLMSERQYGLAAMLIEEYHNSNQLCRLLQVLEADCRFYLKQYNESSAILLAMLKNTKQLRLPVSLTDDEYNKSRVLFSEEEMLYQQSPASIYLRLALISRKLGEIQEYRRYTEKALAFDLSNPINQCAFSMAVRLNHDNSEMQKLQKLLLHWRDTLVNELVLDDFKAEFRQNLLAESILQLSDHRRMFSLSPESFENSITTKLKFAISTTDRSSDTGMNSISGLVHQFKSENQKAQHYSLSHGLSSVLYQFLFDDLWLVSINSLDHALLTIWPSVEQYFLENEALHFAQMVYCSIGIRMLILNSFYMGLGIFDYLPSKQFDLVSLEDQITQIIKTSENSQLWDDVNMLWQWYQALNSGTTILLDDEMLAQLSATIQPYYVYCARKSETNLTANQFSTLLLSPTVEGLTQIALTYLENGNALESWRLIKRALGMAPENAIVRYCYARIASKLEQKDAVIEGLHSALELWPDESSWHRWSARLMIQDFRFDEASMHLEYLSQKGLSSEEEKIELVRAYIHQKAFNKASRMIIQISDDTRFDHSRRALLLLLAIKKGSLDKINSLFRELACKDNLSREAYLEMAELELTNGHQNQALKISQAAYHYSPTHPRTLLMLSKCLIACGHINDASKILSQIPHNATTSVQVTKLRLLKMIPDADIFKEEIASAYEHHPDDPDIAFLEAKSLVEEGQKEKALELLAVILQQENVKAEHHSFAGRLHNDFGNLDKAVNHLNLALQENRNDPETLLLLASVHLKRREMKKALDVYQKGIQACVGDYRFYYEAGRLLREMKLYGDAEFMMRKASEIVPGRKDIRNQLGAIMALNFVHNAQ